MGKRKNQFSASQRWAIWTVYGMKCFRCHKTVEFDQCEVDRIIPDSVSKIVLKGFVKEYELGNEFSVNGYENLVPICPACSKSKSKVFRPSPDILSWFEQIRKNAERVEGKVRLIEADQSAETVLKQLVEKLERGEVSSELVEALKPFLETVEGKPKGNVELRLSDSARLFYSPEGLRLQPVAEIRYEKFVDGMLESGDWRKRSPETLKEGPSFGEGRPRRPGSGA